MDGGEPKKYVFSIGLIPVQDYISEARRSRDLRWGSAFLSRSTVLALNVLKKDLKAEISVPEIEEETFVKIFKSNAYELMGSGEYSIPNRASGFFLTGSEEDAKRVFRSLGGAVRNEWEGLLKRYLKSDYKTSKDGEVYESFQKIRDGINACDPYIECPLQVVWAVLEAETSGAEEERLQSDLKRIDRYYSEIKRFRPVEPWKNGAHVGKCTMCGKREALGENGSFLKWRNWYNELCRTPWMKKEYWFDQSERLCPACAVKRISSYDDKDSAISSSFPSTNEIACRHWLNSIKALKEWKTEIVVDYEGLKADLRSLDLPEDIYLALFRRGKKRLQKKLEPHSAAEKTKKILAAAGRIHDKLKAMDFEQSGVSLKKFPSDYLAVIVYDGDSMGKKVRENPGLVCGQMREFSGIVSDIVRDFHAEAFYIGGDEGLALCPLENAIALPMALRESFVKAFRGPDNRSVLTLSAAAVVFDRERPLGGAIKQAHQLLKLAKEARGKNRFAAGVETASGNRFHFVGGWDRVWGWLLNMLQAIENGEISMSWASEAEGFVRGIPAALFYRPDAEEPVKKEIMRITGRKMPGPLAGPEKKERLKPLFQDFDVREWFKEFRMIDDMDVFANQFHVLRFLSRH